MHIRRETESDEHNVSENNNLLESQFIYGIRGEKYDRYKWCLVFLTRTRQHNMINVLFLILPIANTNHNITDGWFTTIKLLDKLQKMSIT